MCNSLAPVVSTSPLEGRTPVAVHKRDVHRVERATFVGQATVCKVYSKLLHVFACFNTSACALVPALGVAGGVCSYHERSLSMVPC